MAKKRKYTKELLQTAVSESVSCMGVLRLLNLRISGSTQGLITKRIKEYGIDTSHFLGKAANCGSNHKGGSAKKTWQEVLIIRKSADREESWRLRRALIESGRPYRCESENCIVVDSWLGKPITLHVDHINGNWKDCRPDNLKFRCPNCHDQTPNHSNRQGKTNRTNREW
jgi:hypothetical protein